jgi:hypothetical protein
VRHARAEIRGADGWEVNTAAQIFNNRRKQPITNLIAYWPTVDLGYDYRGPVPPPGIDPDWRDDAHPERTRMSTLRLVDEIVAYAFHGDPPYGWRASSVHHKDGDYWNCHADNLAWTVNEAFVLWKSSTMTRNLLRPHNLPRYVRIGVVGRQSNRTMLEPPTLHTSAPNIPGHIPTSPQRMRAS